MSQVFEIIAKNILRQGGYSAFVSCGAEQQRLLDCNASTEKRYLLFSRQRPTIKNYGVGSFYSLQAFQLLTVAGRNPYRAAPYGL